MIKDKKKSIGLSLKPLLAVSDDKYIQIKVSSLIPGEFQPRRLFSEKELKELAKSIQDNGVLQPLLVRVKGDNYEIVAGERRWRASKLIGLKHVPAIVSKISDEQALAYGVVENIQRQDLNPIEEALAVNRLINEFGMTHEEVSNTVGKKRSTISNMLRLLKLSDYSKECLINKHIELSQAKILAGIPAEQQDEACQQLIKQGLSARETERFLSSVKQKKSVEKASHNHPDSEIWERKISSILEMNVKIKINESAKGKIEVYVNDEFQVQQFIDSLS